MPVAWNFLHPVINLFSRSLDRISLSDRFSEFMRWLIVTGRWILNIRDGSRNGLWRMAGQEQVFRPFYLAAMPMRKARRFLRVIGCRGC